MGDDGGESLISPDAVAPSRMVGVSALTLLSSLAPLSPGEDFFWHRLAQVVLNKRPYNSCVCVCWRLSGFPQKREPPVFGPGFYAISVGQPTASKH